MRSMRSIPSLPVIALAAGLALSACSGADDSSTTDDMTSTDGDTSSMPADMDEMDDNEHEDFAFGEPADEADADRIVEVEALDSLTYDPPSIAVEVGETITFVVHNAGAARHEFTIGDAEHQDEHAAEMAEMTASGMMMGDEANAIGLDSGETKRITWHFTTAGEFSFACHEPGHYAAGMVGTFQVG